MLRIQLGSTDLARIRFCLAPHVETVGSVQAMQFGGVVSPFVDGWRRAAARRLPDSAAPLLEVVPMRGHVPDFLTPAGASIGPTETAYREVLATPPRVIRDQLEAAGRTGTIWLRRLARAEPTALAELGTALRTYQSCCVSGWWATAHALLAAELARRAHQLLSGGIAEVLATLGPGVRWRPPVLEVDCPAHAELGPSGAGLWLIPSVFWPRPAAAIGHRIPSVVYPVHPAPASPSQPSRDPLEALLGRGRADVVRALVTGGGTVAIAERLGVSPATVSEHVAVLRRVGLAATQRRGRAVHHSLTPLGLALLFPAG